jgi:hypothetical protein
MSSPVRKHRAPVRYSLKPHEVRRLLAEISPRGGATLAQIGGIAARLGTARKTIVEIFQRNSLKILDTPAPEPKPFFKPKIVPTDADEPQVDTTGPSAEEDYSKIDEALEVLAQEEGRLHEEQGIAHTLLIEEEARHAAEIAEERAKLQAQEARTRTAIRQTAELRRQTRSEREGVDELKAQITILEHKLFMAQSALRKAQTRNDALDPDLRASLAREIDLIERNENLLDEALSYRDRAEAAEARLAVRVRSLGR